MWLHVLVLDCLLLLLQGWTPAYFRIAPYTVLAFVLMEQARLLLGMQTL